MRHALRRLGFAAAALAVSLAFAAPSQAAQAAFENREALTSALKLQARLQREATSDARPVADLVKQGVAQIRAGEWREAAVSMALAAGKDPKNEQAWRNLSVALTRVETDDYSERERFKEQAVGAASRAYELSTDAKTRGRALAVLANALVYK